MKTASTFYTSTERLTRLKLLTEMYLYLDLDVLIELDVLQLFLQDLFIILIRFLAGSCSVKMSQAFHDPSINFHRTWER